MIERVLKQVMCVMLMSAMPAARDESTRDVRSQIQARLGTDRFMVMDLAPDVAADGHVRVPLTLDGDASNMVLRPVSVRAPDFRVIVPHIDGSAPSVTPPAPHTYRGEIAGMPGSIAAATVIDGRISALIRLAGGELWSIQPAATLAIGAQPQMHVLHRAIDMHLATGRCQTQALSKSIDGPQDAQGNHGPDGLTSAILAFDADFEFFQLHNGSVPETVADIESILNAINVIYERQVGITYSISTILVWTAEPDPYISTSAGPLFGQFQLEWNTNQYFITRDAAQLMTGKNVDNNVVGLANLGVICAEPMGSYSMVQSLWTPVFAARVATSAHELGHNWNADHCNGQPDCGIMCATIGACPGGLANFGVSERNQIIAWRDSVTCMAAPIPPRNDDCENAATVNVGATNVRTTNAITDGPAEPNGCGFGADAQIEHDAWYVLTSPCTGLAIIGVCGSDFDARLAVYAGCPTGSGQALACDDNSCGMSPRVSLHVDADVEYRIRIGNAGGPGGATGTGVMTITCQAEPTNNNCASATTAPIGSTPFTTELATTDGPDEPGQCRFNGRSLIANDVWFKYLAQCTGNVTVSLCGASFDARVAVYQACPAAPGSVIVCNDDSCGQSPQVTFAVTAIGLYRIRIGGSGGATGTGTMVISCVPLPPACSADANHDGLVNGVDLQIVLDAWGPCPATETGACPGDVNSTGAVDMDDVIAVIMAWGPCPTAAD